LLLEQAGIAAADVPAADIVDTRWHGYLANVSVSEFFAHFARHLPQSLSGRAFLRRFDGTTDTVTRVDPDRDYAVFSCTSHPIHEHCRVRLFARMSALHQGRRISADAARLMGECMFLSHTSYSDCGLGSHGTDDLIARVRRIGPQGGIYGARITGGGNGGTVAVLAHESADDIVRTIAADYARASGIGGHVFSGSSDGANAWTLAPGKR
jgi:L-arabinokinase